MDRLSNDARQFRRLDRVLYRAGRGTANGPPRTSETAPAGRYRAVARVSAAACGLRACLAGLAAGGATARAYRAAAADVGSPARIGSSQFPSFQVPSS